MTRKRVGQGLHEVFAETCEACNGRGYHIHTEPVEKNNAGTSGGERKGPRGGGRSRCSGGDKTDKPSPPPVDVTEVEAAPIDLTEVEPSPVAVEDPVEAPVVADAAEAAPKAPRRRRKAVSPVTTL
jgi:ribonuclease E